MSAHLQLLGVSRIHSIHRTCAAPVARLCKSHTLPELFIQSTEAAFAISERVDGGLEVIFAEIWPMGAGDINF